MVDETVSLEGTLGSFGLADVLHLLSSAGKTGRLRLDAGARTGPRPLAASTAPVGHVWLEAGLISWATAHPVPPARPAGDPAAYVVDELTELLRWTDGSFRFEPETGPAPERLAAPVGVDDALAEVGRRRAALAEAGGPDGLAARLAVRPEPGPDPVTLDAGEWRVVAAVGRGCRLGELPALSGLGELRTYQVVTTLLGRGLLIRAGWDPGAELDAGGELDQDDGRTALQAVLAELEAATALAPDPPPARAPATLPARAPRPEPGRPVVDRELLDRLTAGIRRL
jgi:hypothetical protein